MCWLLVPVYSKRKIMSVTQVTCKAQEAWLQYRRRILAPVYELSEASV